jgi:secreted trypsin-like serine protease
MANTRNDNLLWLLVILLLNIVKPSYQTIYPCNASASCGCSTQPVSITRIVGGENAGAATWGWAVSISIGNTYLCGGSIISSSWVITAAHCVTGYTASQVTIFAGSITRFSGTQSSVGSNLIVHESYDPNTYVNDIALLQLASPLSMSDPNLSLICLPSVSAATLSAGEWPPVGTSVSYSFPSFILDDVHFQYFSIGCRRWMGHIK